MPRQMVVADGVETALNQLAKIVAKREEVPAPRKIVVSDERHAKDIRIDKKVITIHTTTVAKADLLELVKRCIALEVQYTSTINTFIRNSIKSYRIDAEVAIEYLARTDPKFESWIKKQLSTVLEDRMKKNGLA